MSSRQPVLDSLSSIERRRSHRMQATTSVRVAWHTDAGAYARAQAETEDVSAHGALLLMDQELDLRSVVVLNHGAATNWAMARVMRTGPRRPNGFRHVAVELAVPSETFWSALGWAQAAARAASSEVS